MNAIWLRTCKAQNALTSRWYASAASLMNSDETYIAIWSNSQAMTVSLVESLKHHGRRCRGHLSTPVSWPLDPLPAASCKPLTICSSKAGASCCSSSPAKWKACEGMRHWNPFDTCGSRCIRRKNDQNIPKQVCPWSIDMAI